MRYLVLATDYDGTLATEGRVSPKAVEALERLRASGRRLILVTGRQLDDLQQVFARLDLFDRVVAENGALLYRPATKDAKVLAERPPDQFISALRARHVEPLSVGEVVVATLGTQNAAVLDVIRALGLPLVVAFNRDSLMVLPAGVDKASGLAAALEELQLSAHQAVGVGDAENDQAFLTLCGRGVAVANAVPALKERADYVTQAGNGDGVAEVVARLLADDLADVGRYTLAG